MEDVMARVGQQAGELRHAPSGGANERRLGTVVVALSDLEALFERIAESERQVDEAEARLQTAEDEARFLLGRLAELCQQLETERERSSPVSSSPSSRPMTSPPPPRSARAGALDTCGRRCTSQVPAAAGTRTHWLRPVLVARSMRWR